MSGNVRTVEIRVCIFEHDSGKALEDFLYFTDLGILTYRGKAECYTPISQFDQWCESFQTEIVLGEWKYAWAMDKFRGQTPVPPGEFIDQLEQDYPELFPEPKAIVEDVPVIPEVPESPPTLITQGVEDVTEGQSNSGLGKEAVSFCIHEGNIHNVTWPSWMERGDKVTFVRRMEKKGHLATNKDYLDLLSSDYETRVRVTDRLRHRVKRLRNRKALHLDPSEGPMGDHPWGRFKRPPEVLEEDRSVLSDDSLSNLGGIMQFDWFGDGYG